MPKMVVNPDCKGTELESPAEEMPMHIKIWNNISVKPRGGMRMG